MVKKLGLQKTEGGAHNTNKATLCIRIMEHQFKTYSSKAFLPLNTRDDILQPARFDKQRVIPPCACFRHRADAETSFNPKYSEISSMDVEVFTLQVSATSELPIGTKVIELPRTTPQTLIPEFTDEVAGLLDEIEGFVENIHEAKKLLKRREKELRDTRKELNAFFKSLNTPVHDSTRSSKHELLRTPGESPMKKRPRSTGTSTQVESTPGPVRKLDMGSITDQTSSPPQPPPVPLSYLASTSPGSGQQPLEEEEERGMENSEVAQQNQEYARKLSKRMSNIRRTRNWRSNTKLKTRSRLECDRPKGAFRLGQMERGRQLVEGWDRLVMDGIPWENIFNTDGEVVMLGRKNLAVYCLAQSLSMGFELTTAAALASRQYLVSEQVVIAIWYKWNKSEEAFVMSMRGKASKNQWLLSDPDLRVKAKEYISTNATKKGDERFTPAKFQVWLNTDEEGTAFLKRQGGDAASERNISLRTTSRYASMCPRVCTTMHRCDARVCVRLYMHCMLNQQ